MIAGVACWSLACARSRTPVEIGQRSDRNVLLVTIDTLRADALGCEGGPARTPHLDNLAASGLRFTFAHAHAVVTLPAHASILTGRYPHEHGYRDNAGYRLKPGTETLAMRLKAAGFATGAFVAAFPLDARFGLTPGFDLYDGRFDDSGSGGEFLLPQRPGPAVVARAVTWIAARRDRWFAWVHVYEPHAPYAPPAPFDREYASQPYYGEVAAADAALGPLFEAVRRGGRETLVVVTGDHGEGLGEHGEATHGLFAYEPTLRVPLIMAEVGANRKATAESAEISDAPAYHVDILPTILDALNVPVSAGLPGRSLRRAAARADTTPRAAYFEAMSPALEYGWAPLAGVLVGREKYIDLPLRELYDLGRDSRESDNRAPGDSERTRAMTAQLADLHVTPPGAPQRESTAAAARLRSLGYIAASTAPKARFTEEDDPKRLVDLDRRMHDASMLDEAGRLREAVVLYKEVLARRPDMIAASRHLAFDYWRLGDGTAAVDTLRAALRAGRSPGTQVQLGSYFVEMGRTTEAIAILTDAASAEQTFDAFVALGLAHGRSGHAADALAAFGRALEIDPDNAIAFENIGAVQLDAGRLDEAKRSFERAVAANPASSHAHNGLALVAIRTGDHQAAIEQWRRAVELQPSNFDALHDLGVQLARDGQGDAARRYLTQFVKTAPAAQYARELAQVNAILAQMR